jgi:hypothetical protein
MKRQFTMLAFGAGLVLAGSASAQSAPVCDAGDPKTKVMRLLTGDQVRDMTVQMVLPMGLGVESLATDRIVALPRTCARGSFLANGKTYQVFGAAGGAAVRWTAAEDGTGPVAYIVRFDFDMRALNPGYKSSGWLLVKQDGDMATVVRAYTKIPEDKVLPAEFQGALTERFTPVAGFDRKTQAVTIFMPPS